MRCRNSIFGHIFGLAEDTPAHQTLRCHVSLLLGPSPDRCWRRCSGLPRSRWLGNLRRSIQHATARIYGNDVIDYVLNEFLFGYTQRMFRPNLKSVASPVPDIIAIGVLSKGCEPQSWGRGGRRGRGWYRLKERWWVSLNSNFSSICTRFRDIAAFVLKHTVIPHPTSSLLKISACSPGIRWVAFGLRREKVLG